MKKFSNVPSATVLVGASFLFVVACGDEEPASNDDGAGGTAPTGGAFPTGGRGGTTTGGTATGGTATGGTATGGGAGVSMGGVAGTPAGGSGGASAGAGGAGAAGAAGAGGAGGAGAGGAAGAAGAGGAGGAGGMPPGAQARYSFETASTTARDGAPMSDMGWTESMDYPNVTVAQSTMAHAGATGMGSLRMAIMMQGGGGGGAGGMGGAGAGGAGAGAGGAGAGAGGAGAGGAGAGAGGAGAGGAGAGAGGAGAGGAPASVQYYMKDADPPLVPGQTITFNIRVPMGTVDYMNLVIEDVNYSWTTYSVPIPATRDMFAQATYAVPVSVVPPIRGIGFQVSVPANFAGDFYLDEISWMP